MLGKGVYSCEYVGDREKCNEISLPEKEDFYSHLNVTRAKLTRTQKRVCKDFKVRNLGDYHDLYAQSNTLLLANVFENFLNMCLKIYQLDPAHFLFASGLA